MSPNKISAVPTNVITGFLGVGKTTAIQQLLKNKPAQERWAILVNEFGEIGIDGSFLQGKHREDNGIYVQEVPGGCMCCTAGLSMQIALNQLLSKARPHRLLIEPTGLGHPVEVMACLTADHYQDVLNIQSIITLVDARKLTDDRYTNHETFNQQIKVADVVVGNKQDRYKDIEQANLVDYVNRINHQKATVHFVSHGNLNFDWLNYPSKFKVIKQNKSHHSAKSVSVSSSPLGSPSDQPIPDSGYLKAVNQGEGFYSIGWRFSPELTFSRERLLDWINGLAIERLKGVFITEEGIFGYNLSDDVLTEMMIDDCFESRVEMLSSEVSADEEQGLLNCIEKTTR
ncbi:GTP-binding protein [Aliikangiella marina]|uniref:GTP-binding protein n=1 Tax=Aliikangiella marina TaxID=1712262 RepID=A0A545T4F1_9GAMM|nr:CobW family GTP-binding protein [Aliikangiella marina]TQV72103.1 GTP-binding protein [Aliikangiella marina]